jgi:D-alanine transaminase
MIVYYKDQFISKDEVGISPDDRGFLFADGVYEVVLAYRGGMFRFDDHLARLGRSLGEIRIDLPDLAGLCSIAEQLLLQNNLTSAEAKVYIQVTRGAAVRHHSFPEGGASPTLYIMADPFHRPVEDLEKGAAIILAPDIRWTRCDIKAIGLLPNVLANQQAKENGAIEAVFVRDGFITEGTHTNLFTVRGERLFTPPLNNHILSGITRQVVIELCSDLGLLVTQTAIPEKALKEAEEIMITSTISEIMPVVRVDDWPVADGRPGPVTRRLQQAFNELTGTASTSQHQS